MKNKKLSAEVIEGSTSVIPNAVDSQTFQFSDGRIVLEGRFENKPVGLWTSDGGQTFSVGPMGPGLGGQKVAFDFGDGEVLSVYRTSIKKTDNSFKLVQIRSYDNWRSNQIEEVSLDTPRAVPLVGDNCEREDGMLMHHGMVKLKNGDLLATMYGLYSDDDTPMSDYPTLCEVKKYRVIVVRSTDRGKTWEQPVTVAHSKMLNPVSGKPYLTREGFNEADIVQAPNGDLLVVMRSGGINSNYPGDPTPLYMSRSTDEGKTWSLPSIVAPFGTNPNIIALKNGILVLAYSGADDVGNEIIFSSDSGFTWDFDNKLNPTRSATYSDIVPLSKSHFLFLYHKGEWVTTSYQVLRDFYVYPQRVNYGGSSTLNWSMVDSRNCILSGGSWGKGTKVSASGEDIDTEALYEDTTYKIKCESILNPNHFREEARTVKVE